jgi:hypothetical protein
MPTFEEMFQGVSDWLATPQQGNRLGFPTCRPRTATANANVFTYPVAVFRGSVGASAGSVTALDIGIDPAHSPPEWAPWRWWFTRVTTHARASGFFHGFPTFHVVPHSMGDKLRMVVLPAQAVPFPPRPPSPSVTAQQVPAADLFPPPSLPIPLPFPLPPTWWTVLPPEAWLDAANSWALNNDAVAALPTGWIAETSGGWTVELIVFDSNAVTLQDAPGSDLFAQERCAAQFPQPTIPTTCSGTGTGGIFGGGTATPAHPLAQAPIGTALNAPPATVDFLRCLAGHRRAESELCTGDPADRASLAVTRRPDNRTLVFFRNIGAGGAWLVAHTMDPTSGYSTGEVASYFLPSRTLQDQFAFELTGGTASPGQVSAQSVGIVKQGVFGVPTHVASFAWGTWLALSPGMNVSITWAGR